MLASMRCASDKSTGPIETTSIANHLDHGGDAAERRERKALDRLLIGDDLVGAGGQQAIDAPDPERMFEGDDFTSGTDGHARLPFAKAPAPTLPAKQHALPPPQ
jgi:hypothetical protein